MPATVAPSAGAVMRALYSGVVFTIRHVHGGLAASLPPASRTKKRTTWVPSDTLGVYQS